MTIKERLKKVRCPKCGRKVFIPGENWQRFTDGKPIPKSNPLVLCSDMGHWLGQLNDCAEI